MPEVREITTVMLVPEDVDWVVINEFANKFSAVGFSANAHKRPFFTPSPFACLKDALEASSHWATENQVPVIYVHRAFNRQISLGVNFGA